MSPVVMLLALASMDPAVAALVEAAPSQQAQTRSKSANERDVYDLGEITATSAKRGAAIGDFEPELVLDEEQIKAYGASSIAELLQALAPQTRSSRGGSGMPVLLVNGRRISGFQEIQGLPPEAIERTEVLPEDAALAYGYTADQRVVNFVLKAQFRSVTSQASTRRPDQGGRTVSQLENNFLRIAGKQRWTMDLEYRNETPLFETERDIIRSTDGAPYDLLGNVTAPGGGEIDPALSARFGAPVKIAGVTPAAADGSASLADFTNGARTGDLNAYRTLLPKREQGTVRGSVMHDLNGTTALTVSGSLEDTTSFSFLGLPGVRLTLPTTSPYSPFGNDVILNRYVNAPDALSRTTDTLAGKAGFVADGFLGDWRWTLTGGYDRTEVKTSTGRGLDATTLQAGVSAGTINPFADLPALPTGGVDTARSVSSLANAEVVFNGNAWDGPAGRLNSTLKVGFNTQSLDSESVRSGVFSERSLSRNRASASGNFNLPIASRSREVLGALGDLSANLNLGYEDLSDFGGLTSYTLGLNWTPWEPVSFTASYANEQNAPSMSQLNDPTISTPNVPVYDFATGQSVNITRIEGGNLGLSEETKKTLRFGVNLTPIKDKDLRITANYTRTQVDGSIASFPTITPELEAALPERFVRAPRGQCPTGELLCPVGELLSIDARPLNFQGAERQEIRWGFNYSTPFGKPDPAAAARMGMGMGGAGGPRSGGPGGPGGGPRPGGGAPIMITSSSGGGGGGGATTFRMGGGGPRGGGMQAGQGRFNFSLYHTYRLQDEITIRDGLPVLDLLDGAATGSRGGQPRNEIQMQTGVFKSGMGAFMNANWRDSTRIDGGGAGAQDLTFSDQTTVGLNVFADLSSRPTWVAKYPWLKGARVNIGVENLFDSRLEVRDAQGNTPLSYQSDYLDPLGRTFRISLRKILF
ncbi:TonB-dependent receptor [Brevundimonas sp. 2YAF1]|uniref:TonB-dependent receptor n=2 Tax=unclassified Brevundimonas TaxID=2622653 RepID=UPI003F936E50